MTFATINGNRFLAPLEPDGHQYFGPKGRDSRGSHWFRPPAELIGELSEGAIEVDLEVVKDWPDPELPADLQAAFDAEPALWPLWEANTALSKWDWIRWIRATNNPKTREKHIAVACDKLRKGSKRPCCFNRSACTDPSVSKGGVLI